jgi:outer membrane protein OmpA-like peptidoglycan-associated protein
MRHVLAAALLLGLASCATAPAGPKSYAVFFAAKSSALDPAAVELIGQVATAAKAGTGRVQVLGWTGNGGSPDADVTLSQQRADRVANALVVDGVQRERIVQEGRGQTGTDPGVESRRVEIRIEP